MTNLVQYKGYNSNRLHSPAIWADCPIVAIQSGGVDGKYFFDDFLHFQDPTTAKAYGKYYCLDTGDSTLTLDPADSNGALRLLVTTDEEDCGIILTDSATTGGAFVLPDNSDNSFGQLWFECRVKRSNITDSVGSFFIGLAEPAALAANFIADAANDFADVDLFGFWNLESDDSVGSHVHAVTQKAGAGFDTIIDTAATLVANTYVKLGFVYNPNAAVAKRIKFYVDGVEQGTGVGENSGDATVYLGDTTNFPGDEEMAPIFYTSCEGAADLISYCDWWACAQLK